jgi:hypothetical protein
VALDPAAEVVQAVELGSAVLGVWAVAAEQGAPVLEVVQGAAHLENG